jgi:hypothetical protein
MLGQRRSQLIPALDARAHSIQRRSDGFRGRGCRRLERTGERHSRGEEGSDPSGELENSASLPEPKPAARLSIRRLAHVDGQQTPGFQLPGGSRGRAGAQLSAAATSRRIDRAIRVGRQPQFQFVISMSSPSPPAFPSAP